MRPATVIAAIGMAAMLCMAGYWLDAMLFDLHMARKELQLQEAMDKLRPAFPDDQEERIAEAERLLDQARQALEAGDREIARHAAGAAWRLAGGIADFE